MKSITSSSNEFYKELVQLTKNKKHEDMIFFEGEDLVKEADSKGILKYVIINQEDNAYNPTKIPNILLSQNLYRNLASFKSLPKMMGIAKITLATKLEGDLIYLDGVQDPGNVGTIIRTALALNYKGIILSPDSAYPFSSKVIQSSKGAIFKLPIMIKTIQEFENLKDYDLIGTLLNGEPLNEAQRNGKPIILVFGNEGHGIREKVQQLLNKAYLIPMNEIDSLNVGIAAGIFMYIFRRKK